MMLALGMFIFEIGSLPYQELTRNWEWRHATSERLAALPAAQFTGPGAETVSLSGALYPGEGIGDHGSIETLRAMAETGEAYSLVAGSGEVLGDFFIRSLSTAASLFFIDGMARKADFTLELERAA